MNDPDVILTPYGTLDVWPPRAPDKFLAELKAWRGITADANEIARAYPVLISAAEWMRKAVERYAAAGTAGAEPAKALIELDANRPDWTCFAERANSISRNPDNLASEEIARALLVSDLSVWVPEIQPTLREMQEIKRRMVERLVEAIQGQLVITGYSAADLTKLVTIPARLVTTDHILSLLASGELLIFGRHYVDMRIGPPEPLKVTSEPQTPIFMDGMESPGPVAHAKSPADAMTVGQRTSQPSTGLSQVKPKPKAAAPVEHTRWQRDRAIKAVKQFLHPDGKRPKGVSIEHLLKRLNKLPEFEQRPLSASTLERAIKDIKNEIKVRLEK
jgi:hypothetical protein